MKRQLLALFLALSVILSTSMTASAATALEEAAVSRSAIENGRFIYEIIDDKTALISKYVGESNEVIIPAEIDGYIIVKIGDEVFKDSDLVSVTIPDTVTEIGDDAFRNCYSWSADGLMIVLPESLKTIGNNAFRQNGSAGLSVVVPDSVTEIGDNAFKLCDVYCNEGSYAEKYARSNNTSYILTYGDFGYNIMEDDTVYIKNYSGTDTDVIIPEKINGRIVTRVQSGCFSWNNIFNSISIPATVTELEIGYGTNLSSISEFKVDSNNTTYSSVDGVLYDKSVTTLIKCPSKERVIIPDTVKKIDTCAFFWIEPLKEITIPDSVEIIEVDAFYGCTSLESVTLPDSVVEIAGGAFYGCRSLKNIQLSNNLDSIGAYAFFGCDSLKHIDIPKSVSAIGGEFGDPVFPEDKDFTIGCYANSYAENYAKTNNIPYTLLDEIKNRIFGDIDNDGKVTSADALMVLRMSAGIEKYDSDTLKIADVDGDEQFTSADALELLRFSAGSSSNKKLGQPIA